MNWWLWRLMYTGLSGSIRASTGESNRIWSSWQSILLHVFWQRRWQLPEHRTQSLLVHHHLCCSCWLLFSLWVINKRRLATRRDSLRCSYCSLQLYISWRVQRCSRRVFLEAEAEAEAEPAKANTRPRQQHTENEARKDWDRDRDLGTHHLQQHLTWKTVSIFLISKQLQLHIWLEK